jgi:hypothetical protein
MSSQETAPRALVDVALQTTAASAAPPPAAPESGTGDDDFDWEAALEADLTEYFDQREVEADEPMELAESDNAGSGSVEKDGEDKMEEDKEVEEEGAALPLASARSEPPPPLPSTIFAPTLFGNLAQLSPAPAALAAPAIVPAAADLTSMVSRLEDEKREMASEIERLQRELGKERKRRGDLVSKSSGADSELGMLRTLVQEKTAEVASLQERTRHQEKETSTRAAQSAAEKHAWAQERQKLIRQAESLESVVPAFRAEEDSRALDDLADRMQCLTIGPSNNETIQKLRSRVRGLSKKLEAARSDGYAAGSQDTRIHYELRHQGMVADHVKLLEEAHSSAVRAEEAGEVAAALFGRAERHYAEQIALLRGQLGQVTSLAERATADKNTADKKASLRKEEYAKLDARFLACQKHLKATEQAHKERARCADDWIASLKLDLQHERSRSSVLAADVANYEARLAVERSSNDDNYQQIAALTVRVEQEKAKEQAERMARVGYARHTVWLNKQISMLTAQLAEERVTKAHRPAIKGLQDPVERRPGRSEFSIFLFGLALFVLLLGVDFLLTESVASNMHPCGIEGGIVFLCLD